MAVGRLSGAWIRAVLQESYPGGVARRELLDHFATLLVSPRAHRGAKGRLARRLYGTLAKLQLRGLIRQLEGVIWPMTEPPRKGGAAPPELGPMLARRLFQALLAEDGQGDGHTPADLGKARRAFICGALEAGWTLASAAGALGVNLPQAAQILGERRAK